MSSLQQFAGFGTDSKHQLTKNHSQIGLSTSTTPLSEGKQ